jgi:OOP family OmpA-OmpF porin
MLSGLLLLAGAALLLLPGCQNVSGFGYTTAFNRNLYEDYLALSVAERDEFDWNDAHFFAAKALTAARDEQVGPETIYERRVPPSKVEELRGARNRLITALDRGAPVKVPVDAARAQASFDCWLQEQEENFQLNDIGACRESFHQAMARVEAALGERYLVYFKFDSAHLNGNAKQVLREVAETAKGKADAAVLISGHADSAGAEDYNLALSQAGRHPRGQEPAGRDQRDEVVISEGRPGQTAEAALAAGTAVWRPPSERPMASSSDQTSSRAAAWLLLAKRHFEGSGWSRTVRP